MTEERRLSASSLSIRRVQVAGTPALVVDGRVWCVGRWPGREPLRQRLQEACQINRL